ncbi:L-serine ammonia-lyase [Propionicicella superfundia]|uniref:L-serine ammonia-lyase n=1 Tax=Propionicicella superfundia TaxID=348582 RepID=UPI00048BCBF6|nr:L-serine ammonia-lyase [Propionicicella superfundia]
MSGSVFDLFTIGIGPSSSHTMGPLAAAARFTGGLAAPADVTRVTVDLYGSLGATGRGHGTDRAVEWGLEGEDARTLDPVAARRRSDEIAATGRLRLGRATSRPGPEIDFSPDDIVFHRRTLPGHPNALRLTAWAGRRILAQRTYFSIGGGEIREAGPDGLPVRPPQTPATVPFPFRTAAELLAHCSDRTIPEVMFANECALRPREEVLHRLREVWDTMDACIAAGVSTDGTLPGGLGVQRRAASFRRHLEASQGRERGLPDQFAGVDWVTLWALAVNEENAAGGRVVTAPTNGAAGVIPAVLSYCVRFVPGSSEKSIASFLLAAGAIGLVYKATASISGAEVGCQGEVGTACSMAAAGAAQILSGSPQQVTNAAEIGMEHNLGLTCDPVGGLVQIPCIERNAMAALKAIAAARLALLRERQQVSLDQVIATMMATGRDMSRKYKETSLGGLAVNLVEC